MTDETEKPKEEDDEIKKMFLNMLVTVERLPNPSPQVDQMLSTLFSEFHVAFLQRHPDVDPSMAISLPFTDNANLTFMLAEFVLGSKTETPKGTWSLYQHGYLNGKYQNGMRSACITSIWSSAPGDKDATPPTGLHWHGFGRFPQTALLSAIIRFILWPNANEAQYLDYSKSSAQPSEEDLTDKT